MGTPAGGRTHTVFVGALEVDLRIPASRSLKDKRAVLRQVLDGARHRFPVAGAEVGEQDKWQRARLGFSAVASTAGHVEDVLDRVERFVWSFPEIEVLACDRSWLE